MDPITIVLAVVGLAVVLCVTQSSQNRGQAKAEDAQKKR
jgi:hypothetical protein